MPRTHHCEIRRNILPIKAGIVIDLIGAGHEEEAFTVTCDV